ncbi:MAG: HK97 family phage prohead protease [Desulfarculaceae bacterium]|jgi:HK97 family phage prohead protease
MKLVHKLINFSVSQVDDQARTFWAVASTGGVDRQGDEIIAQGWELDNFLQNPVIPWAHDYERPPVAKALEVRVDGDRLLFQAQFPGAEEYAFADTIFRLYRGGYLSAFSVGFAPLESEVVTNIVNGRTLTGTRYLRQELYEISCVTLPANPQALVALSAAPRPLPNPMPVKKPQPAGLGAVRQALLGTGLDRLIISRLRHRLGQGQSQD